jgi:hypothetical protein
MQRAAAGHVMMGEGNNNGEFTAQQGETAMLKRALVAMPIAAFGIVALAACTPSTPNAAPSTPAPTVLTTTASSAAPAKTTSPTATQAADTTSTGCKVNPANAPVPTADPYEWVPKADTVQVSMTDIPSHTVQVTGAPVEVDVTVCNNSPVAYPQVGFVFALDHCGCANNPQHMADGTVQTYNHGQWVTVPNSRTGTGMDYLGSYANQQPLPKGQAVTLRYRFSYAHSMASGQGGVIGAVVTPDGPHVLGDAELSFTVNH